MKILGYSYNADNHCESCMYNYAREVPFEEYDWQDYSEDDITDPRRPGFIQLDIAVELEIIKDSENNPIHPILSYWWYNIGEGNQTLNCSDCGAELDTYEDK